MDTDTVNEIISRLPRGRTLFRYYPGRFACLLLSIKVHTLELLGVVKGGNTYD